ncbi:tetratricopeptide repeat protein [Rhodocaloribacter litoris]|uniref:tetratricopeptide repeat protein n=1 Tax=Rhodocaloribacter litoris TaxID=2558931 RepID=UPI001422B1AA|nr:tetratricopeptide repeat protein [Rhodocaloribacter litoris]QXD13888.1 tetratricopeptide repeat protein [Rhodocaloribacter litoris]GIV60325.1 MAG: hypothetical protein KatS3mg043_1414 [Rhodothermaceae bacterium]
MIRFRCLPTRFLALLAGVLLVLGGAACATVPVEEDLTDHEGRIEQLQQRIARNPDDAEALRDLGIIYLRTRQYGRASEYLEMAFARDPGDPATLFHLGMVNEALGKRESALRLYEKYPEVSRASKYRKLMAGRYEWVVRRMMEEDVRDRLRREQELRARGDTACLEPVEPRVVGVYPLVYQGQDERYAALGRGLAEMITIDLTHVNSLRVVERVRLQELIDEINLAQTALFDPGTAPRVGCLMGAGRLLGGVYNVLGDDDLRLDATVWEDEETVELDPQTDALRRLFELEKALVFSFLDRIGVQLTPEERQRIEYIPTQNLQAFLAYSRGLEREDAGAYGDAAAFYQQAARLDPAFTEAADRADKAEGQVTVAGPVEGALSALFTPAGPTVDPMGSRLRHLTGGIGASLVPGQDNRNPAEEAGSTTATLPDPPPPPSRGN